MNEPLSRREFLKLAGLAPLAYISYKAAEQGLSQRRSNDTPLNVIVLVFDAWSAQNTALYGYPRETTPQLNKLAERALVYHQHIAAGSYTTSGTASLLTGTYPWTHRALQLDNKVSAAHQNHNLFAAFPGYERLAYSHNPLANTFFYQFEDQLDTLKKRTDLYALTETALDQLFDRDYFISDQAKFVTWNIEERLRPKASLFANRLLTSYIQKKKERTLGRLADLFPNGLPELTGEQLFTLEDGLDWALEAVSSSPSPFLGYFHFLPPHDPYNTRRDFLGLFEDEFTAPVKPEHVFSVGVSDQELAAHRRDYDEFIAYVDAEFGRFYTALKAQGSLENTILVLTSDHGEMFERGIWEHITPALHQPVIHIPLVIFHPEIKQRVDIHSPTSAVDLLPTLAALTNQRYPDWAEGVILPPFNNVPEEPGRAIYTVEAKDDHPNAPLTKASFALIRWPYKLTWYTGYQLLENSGGSLFEMFDLENDPEELTDLYLSEPVIAEAMRNELTAKVAEVNAPIEDR